MAAGLVIGATTLPTVPAQAAVFANHTDISISDLVPYGLFTPYPSKIDVTGLAGTITDVNVTIDSLDHPRVDELNIVLIGPDGVTYAVLMADVAINRAHHADITFDDAAGSFPPISYELEGGTFRPTNNGSYYLDASLTSASLAAFNGKNPNGTWSLYGGDDQTDNTSGIIFGWSLNITTALAPSTVTSFTPSSGPVGTSVVITGTNLTGATAVKFGGIPAAAYEVDSSTQITATVPAGAMTGPITVVGPAGTATSSSNFTVTSASGTHARDVSIKLNGKKATGRVDVTDGSAACGSNVPVKVQHLKHGRWQTVAGVLTNPSGAYKAGGLGAGGRYRTIAKQVTLPSGDVCLKDISPIAKQ